MQSMLGWFKERVLGKASHRKVKPQLITSSSSFSNISEGKKVTYKLLWWTGWCPSKISSSDDTDFYAFPHLVTSFRSWMGHTGRANKHDSRVLLGTVQASRAISYPPCGFAFVYSLLLFITQSHNKGTSERRSGCGNILKNELKSPSLANKLQVPQSSLLP